MQHTFSGGVFSDTLDNGRAGAEIQLMTSGLTALTPDGQSFVVRYNECQVEVGGFSGRMIFCRSGDESVTIFCEDRRFPNALAHASRGLLDEQLGLGLKKSRSQSRRGRLIGTAILVGFLTLAVAGYFGLRAGAEIAAKALPVSVDKKLGATAFATMDLDGPEIHDKTVVGAMQSVVDRLVPEAAIDGLEFEVHVVDAPTINAFALPGGTIVVFTGLIRTAENAEQVAAVLAHEMSHATLRHGMRQISQSMGIWAAVTLLVGDAGGLMAAGADLLQAATINSYSRDQENAADEEGVRMLHAAGINPRGLSQFFELLEVQHGDLPGMLSWITTHPDHASRIANVDAIVDALPQREYQPLNIDWQKVQRQIRRDDQREAGAD